MTAKRLPTIFANTVSCYIYIKITILSLNFNECRHYYKRLVVWFGSLEVWFGSVQWNLSKTTLWVLFFLHSLLKKKKDGKSDKCTARNIFLCHHRNKMSCNLLKL
jgi:hypothetical protein